jgi:hypothetical protein
VSTHHDPNDDWSDVLPFVPKPVVTTYYPENETPDPVPAGADPIWQPTP